MSRIAYLDCASGAAGDMLLGALLDIGLPLDVLRGELAKLPLDGYRIEARRVTRSGLAATHVDVVVDGHGHHPHGHDHHHHHHHDHDHDHHERGLAEIESILDRSTLDPVTRETSRRLFRRLAEAEAAVHGTSPEAVHFHEVGAVDAIVDVVGGVFGLGWLGVDRIVASPLNVGTGTVTMSHGTFAVPPPATARLVTGVPVYGAGEGERLTPTGALLVTGHATAYGPLPPIVVEGIGYGAGTRDPADRPNVLRVLVGQEASAPSGDRVVVLECEIDDMAPQLLAPLLDGLLAEGALDAYYTPIYMKKGRPGLLLTLLAPPPRREALEEVVFRETTTLGIRRQEWDRTILDRQVVPVDTPYGAIGVKLGLRGGRVYNAQPEFEDCQRAARTHGVPLKDVVQAALTSYRAQARP